MAANTQLGQENNQTIGQSNRTSLSVVRPQARDIVQTQNDKQVVSDRVETLTINEIPAWIILLAIIGWLLPTPQEMLRTLWNGIRGKRSA